MIEGNWVVDQRNRRSGRKIDIFSLRLMSVMNADGKPHICDLLDSNPSRNKLCANIDPTSAQKSKIKINEKPYRKNHGCDQGCKERKSVVKLRRLGISAKFDQTS